MIYHWTSLEKAATAVIASKLQARRWRHFLELDQRYASGTSWSRDPTKWQRENPVCLLLDEAKISNPMHEINGNRTFLLTMGMDPDKCFDPNAYKLESTEPDEVFVEGPINLKGALVRVHVLPEHEPAWRGILATRLTGRASKNDGQLLKLVF